MLLRFSQENKSEFEEQSKRSDREKRSDSPCRMPQTTRGLEATEGNPETESRDPWQKTAGDDRSSSRKEVEDGRGVKGGNQESNEWTNECVTQLIKLKSKIDIP